MSTSQKAERVVREFIASVKPEVSQVDLDTPLYADGVGLDSLETAEMSALLEDELGADPFTAADMPQTIRDILTFYNSAPAEA